MVDATIVFIIILIVVAIIAVAASAIWIYYQRQQGTGNGPTPAGPDPSGWSPEIDGPNSAHNFCGVYTFPASSPDQPSPITLDSAILDQLNPVPFTQVDCVDSDQVAAKQVQQTCLGNGVFKGICYGGDGSTFNTGEERVFYVECEKQKCTDTLATVALNFNPSNLTTQTGCLQANESMLTQPIKIERCNLTAPGQLFRIDRQDAQGQVDPSGQYGRIFDRLSGLCIVPSSQNPTPGDKLVLGPCAPADGYVWWFFPPQTVEDPYDGPTKGMNLQAPQQLVYFPNPGQPPPSVGEVTDFINMSHPVSMAAPVNIMNLTLYGDDVTLERLAVNQVADQRYNAQTIDYWLYQLISTTSSDPSTGTNFPWYQPDQATPEPTIEI
jgi:hypothetical protein